MSARPLEAEAPAEAATLPAAPASATAGDLGDPLLCDLSDEQRAVVLAPPGPTLVLAGAGSGKTRALTHRAAYLLRAGVPADRLLLMTFTNQAARQMLVRIAAASAQSHQALSSLWAGTFHHLALRTLRQHGHRIGLSERFVVLDRHDAVDLLASCLGEVALASGRSWPRPGLLLSLLSLAVNSESQLASTLARHQPEWLELLPELQAGYDRFTTRKLQLGLLDFDDLLLGWRLLLLDCADVAEAQRAQFQHILVDEYQDTSRLQAALCDELAAGYRNLMAVGDDAQSIYRFRGADLGSLLTFTARWPEAQVLHLSTNFRSGPDIVRLSNRSIAQNVAVPAAPPRQPMRAALGPPSSPSVLAVRPALVCLPDPRAQAAFVAQRVRELLIDGPWDERASGGVAVLYRHHRHARELQLELVRCGIPYSLRSGQRLGEQAHIKDVLALLRIVHNPRDSLAWGRALRQVAGVGDSGRARLIAALREQAQFGQVPQLSRSQLARVTATGRGALARFAQLLDELTALREQAAMAARRGDWLGLSQLPTQLIAHIVERHYADFARRSFTDAEPRIRELLQLGHTPREKSLLAQQALALGTAGAETVLGDFLSALASGETPGGDEAPGRLVLSSVHQAKGLEFQTVFLLWLCEGHFPSAAALSEPAHADAGGADEPALGEAADAEERRLFYVACTRAREELYLCYPAAAAAQGSLRMSRFLRELDGGDPPFERWSVQIS